MPRADRSSLTTTLGSPGISCEEYAQAHYLSLARSSEAKTGHPDYPEYQEATRLWIKSQIVQRRPWREILESLDRMVREEKWWIQQHGSMFNPPIKVPTR
jgi:hypothetical protein